MQILLPDSFPHAATFRLAILGGILLELPLCALGSFKVLSAFSFAGCSSTIAVVLLVVALPLLDHTREWGPAEPAYVWASPGVVPATGIVAVCSRVHLRTLWQIGTSKAFAVLPASICSLACAHRVHLSFSSTGAFQGQLPARHSPWCDCCLPIIKRPDCQLHSALRPCVQLSLAGHSTYPSVRASMAEPHRFSEALNWAYVTMAAVLGTMAAVGYWYWGAHAHTLVTQDFDLQSPYMHLVLGKGLGVHKVVEALIIMSLVTRVPMLLLALQDVCHSLLAAEMRSSGSAPAATDRMSPVRTPSAAGR